MIVMGINTRKFLGKLEKIRRGSIYAGDAFYCCVRRTGIRALDTPSNQWRLVYSPLTPSYFSLMSQTGIFGESTTRGQFEHDYGIRLPGSSNSELRAVDLEQLGKVQQALHPFGTYFHPDELMRSLRG